MRQFLCSILVICGLILNGCADDPVSVSKTGSISGQVKDAATENFLNNVSISTVPATESVVSDSLGGFLLEDLDTGTYSVRASRHGYKTATVSVEVKPGGEALADILLSASNLPPGIPSSPWPENNSSSHSPALTLTWSGFDPNASDTLFYNLYFGRSGEAVQLIAESLEDTSYFINNLKFKTTYNWQIVARDNEGALTYGPVWNFTTMPVPANIMVYASNQAGKYDIYLTTTDSITMVQLTDDPALDWQPKISPERSKIAFVSRRDIAAHIYLMDIDGLNDHKITQTPIEGYHNYGEGFCWSPDGRYLLYSSYHRLYRIDSDGRNRTLIATAPQGRHFRGSSWSPAGDRIAVVTQGENFYDSELYMINLNTMSMTLIASSGIFRNPNFSPDGSRLAYANDLSSAQSAENRLMNSDIIIYTLSDEEKLNISSGKKTGFNDFFPVWSPLGSHILFVSEPNDSSIQPAIYKMNTDGSNRTLIVRNGTMPDWR